MKYILKFLIVLPFVILLSSFRVKSPDTTYTISIEITNIRNSKGTIQLEVYRSQKAFEVETGYKTYLISKERISGNTLSYKITGLEPGEYGLALLDDENNNEEMDYGWGMPKEGFGFSDYYHTGWSRPTFSDFNFSLDENRVVMMKVRYM